MRKRFSMTAGNFKPTSLCIVEAVGTVLRLIKLLRPHRTAVVASLLLAWAAMVFTVLIPYLVGQAVDQIENGTKADLLPLALAVVIAGVLRVALTVFRRLVAGRVSLDVEYELRQNFYGHLQELEPAFFDNNQTGQLMSRGTSDLQSIRFFLGYGLIFLTQNALTILLSAAVMLWLDPVLGLLALVPLPLVIWTARRYSMRSAPAFREAQQRMAEMTAEAEESVTGIRVIKSFARERHMISRFDESVSRLFRQNVYATRLSAIYNPIIGSLPTIGIAIVLLVGGSRVIAGSMQVGELTSFYIYLMMLAGPMRMLGMSLNMAQRAVASGQRMFEILDREATIVDDPSAMPLSPGPGAVRFQGVSLSYDGSHNALSDINLDIPAGTTVALVGPTGSGKSSVPLLLARLYEADMGTITIDGQDIRDVTLGSLRSVIASAGADPFLFSATVAENIAYARPDADPEAVRLAAERAGAAGFIDELPAGYETMLGERGLTLSGGQRQRLAIARALLADPRILVLDDATSSVDARTEGTIHTALAEATTGRTTFLVAHRLSSIALADVIVVMDHGRVVDSGGHDELLARCPLYSEIAARSAAGDDERREGAMAIEAVVS